MNRLFSNFGSGLFLPLLLFITVLLTPFLAQKRIAHAGAKPDVVQLKAQKIKLIAKAVGFKRSDASAKKFGALTFRNGYSVRSTSSYWGGLSGIAASKAGDKLAIVSDAGFWAMLDLAYKDGGLKPPSEASVGPLLSLAGKPLTRNKDRDAEAITLIKSEKFFGQALISFEDNHRIGKFNLTANGISAPQSYLKLPSITSRLRGNAGLEALAVLQGGKLKGSVVAIAQSRKDSKKNFIGWLVRKGKITKIRFTPPPLDTFRITDAVGLPNGDLMLLERRYKFLTVNIRMRYVRQAELLSGKPIQGRIVLEANNHEHRVDNMEGIAAHINEKGETVMTLISDDNFNGFQQTLLMQFVLPNDWQIAWK